ncbi:MAG: DUF2254 domain-containing protein [Nostocoides sp.]
MISGPVAAAHTLRDGLRAQLWPLPTLAVVTAVVLGLALPGADAAVDSRMSGWLDALLFGGDAGAASTVLDAVASSLITVTALTFSLTVVTLQLASSQFSPRLLRTFTQDLFVQATLALFLATFAYSLTVLRSVRSGGDGEAAFVPRIAVTSSYVLAVLSVIGLVLFLAHLTRQIRVETMLHLVRQDASGTVRAVLSPRGEGGRVSPPDGPGQPVLSTSSGFLLSVDGDDLLDASRNAGAVLVITAWPGDFLVEGTPIGSAYAHHGQLGPRELGALGATVGRAVRTGSERTGAQDVGFGLRQLTDVANKALSPGINDPTTAVHALGHISALLCQLAGCELGPVQLTDDAGARVVLHRPDLAYLLEMSLTQIRHYGAGDPIVVARLYQLLDDLTWHVAARDRSLLDRERRRLDASSASSDFDDVTRSRLASLSQSVASGAGSERRAQV